MKTATPAFTFVELLIAVTVITILTLYGVTTFKANSRQLEHQNAVNKVVELMQKARNMTINSTLYKDYPNTDWNAVVPAGYGVRITRPQSSGSGETAIGYGGRVDLFVDNRYQGTAGCDDLKVTTSSSYCFTDSNGNGIPDEPDIILETYEIPEDIIVKINAVYAVTIIFKPPFADVIMYKNFESGFTDFACADSSTPCESVNESPWVGSNGTDQNTALLIITDRINPNTSQTIYFNRFGGVPELAD